MESYKELRAQAEELLRRANEALAVERADAIARAKAIVDEYELTAFDLGLVKTQHIAAKKDPKNKTFAVKKPKSANPPKYRNPDTGKTWSGFGHEPAWMAGHRDEYLIANQASRKQAA
jgi:DNA-binding protein H-NS